MAAPVRALGLTAAALRAVAPWSKARYRDTWVFFLGFYTSRTEGGKWRPKGKRGIGVRAGQVRICEVWLEA